MVISHLDNINRILVIPYLDKNNLMRYSVYLMCGKVIITNLKDLKLTEECKPQ